MTRIDPILMLDAYKWTLVHPTAADFIYPDLEGNIRACPMAAVALYARRIREPEVHKHADLSGGISAIQAFVHVICGGIGQQSEALGIMRRLLDISRPYQHGYIHGYDRWPLDPLDIWYEHDYDLGYYDGGLARAVLEARDFKIHLM